MHPGQLHTVPHFVVPLQCGPVLHYSVDVRIRTYTEPVPSKYAQLATRYTDIFLQCSEQRTCFGADEVDDVLLCGAAECDDDCQQLLVRH